MPYSNGEFEKVLAVNVLYFWEKPVTTLLEIKRIMSPGGRIVLAFYDKEGMEKSRLTQSGVFTLYSNEEVMRMLEDASFSEVSTEERKFNESSIGVCVIAQK